MINHIQLTVSFMPWLISKYAWVNCGPHAVDITGWNTHSLCLSLFLSLQFWTNYKEELPFTEENKGHCVFLCSCVPLWVFSVSCRNSISCSFPLHVCLDMCAYACVPICLCLCMCVLYVCNARRQLNLLPLITGIVKSPEKDTSYFLWHGCNFLWASFHGRRPSHPLD